MLPSSQVFQSVVHAVVQTMNTSDSTIDVTEFDRQTVLAVMRYVYVGEVDVQRPLMPEVCRFAAR